MKRVCSCCGEEFTKGLIIEDDFFCYKCSLEELEVRFDVMQVDYSEVV